MSQYTDQRKIHKNTVWYDLDHTDLVDNVSQRSADWLDFVTGVTMHRGRVEVNPNGTYSIYFRGNIMKDIG